MRGRRRVASKPQGVSSFPSSAWRLTGPEPVRDSPVAEETPLDRFKQALTGAARAIGREPEADVSWTADAPALQGKSLRVPMPGPLPAARPGARGARASRTASRSGCATMTRRCTAAAMPAEPGARACYDAIERVRYEALGENNTPACAATSPPRPSCAPAPIRSLAPPGADEVPLPDRARADAARAADRPADPRLRARRGRAGARVHREPHRRRFRAARAPRSTTSRRSSRSPSTCCATRAGRGRGQLERGPEKGDEDEPGDTARKAARTIRGTAASMRQEQVAGESGEGEGDEDDHRGSRTRDRRCPKATRATRARRA